MSIYATLWALKFPRFGEYHSGCEWVTLLAQAVPAHIGSEYASMPFAALHTRLCDALRGERPRVVAEVIQIGGKSKLVFEDGSSTSVSGSQERGN